MQLCIGLVKAKSQQNQHKVTLEPSSRGGKKKKNKKPHFPLWKMVLLKFKNVTYAKLFLNGLTCKMVNTDTYN